MNVSPASSSEKNVASALSTAGWPDYDANLRLAQKTRRAVRDEVISIHERRTRQRYNMGLALLGFGCLLLLLAPAIWNGLEDLLAGEHLFDFPTLVAFLVLMLFPAMLAALFAVWKGKQDVEHDRGGVETGRPINIR
jgi:hypothetical protein